MLLKDDTLTEGGFTVGRWKARLEKYLNDIIERSRASPDMKRIIFEDGKASKYSGYVYDAVWMYAKVELSMIFLFY